VNTIVIGGVLMSCCNQLFGKVEKKSVATVSTFGKSGAKKSKKSVVTVSTFGKSGAKKA
jgi:hypothetical protein